jgi:hypothetical protein
MCSSDREGMIELSSKVEQGVDASCATCPSTGPGSLIFTSFINRVGIGSFDTRASASVVKASDSASDSHHSSI